MSKPGPFFYFYFFHFHVQGQVNASNNTFDDFAEALRQPLIAGAYGMAFLDYFPPPFLFCLFSVLSLIAVYPSALALLGLCHVQYTPKTSSIAVIGTPALVRGGLTRQGCGPCCVVRVSSSDSVRSKQSGIIKAKLFDPVMGPNPRAR